MQQIPYYIDNINVMLRYSLYLCPPPHLISYYHKLLLLLNLKWYTLQLTKKTSQPHPIQNGHPYDVNPSPKAMNTYVVQSIHIKSKLYIINGVY